MGLMTDLAIPDLADVLAARRRIAPYLSPTPLYRYPALDALTGAWSPRRSARRSK
jgi:threonine dehydratase